MWKVKTAKANIVSAQTFMSLPPTNESFQPNIPRAHLQCCIWKHADEANPHDIYLTRHGWKRDSVNKTLQPTILQANSPVAPDSILQLVKCGCKSCKPPVVHVLAPCYHVQVYVSVKVDWAVRMNTLKQQWKTYQMMKTTT